MCTEPRCASERCHALGTHPLNLEGWHSHHGGPALDAAHHEVQVDLVPIGRQPVQLGVALDGGQRGPELVRGVGQEAPQLRLGRLPVVEGGLQLVEHELAGLAVGNPPELLGHPLDVVTQATLAVRRQRGHHDRIVPPVRPEVHRGRQEGGPRAQGERGGRTDRKRAEEELRRSHEQLSNLAAYLQSVREEERTSVAREIHDELGQALTALKMDISWLGSKYRDHQTLFEKTRSMANIVDSTIRTVKRICTELRPRLLDDLGLVAAIEWQTSEFLKRTGIECEVEIFPDEIALDRGRSTALFFGLSPKEYICKPDEPAESCAQKPPVWDQTFRFGPAVEGENVAFRKPFANDRENPVVKLADGNWFVGDYAEGAPSANSTLFLQSEFAVASVRWLPLDISRVVTVGQTWVEPDLSRVDEIGFERLRALLCLPLERIAKPVAGGSG